MAHFHLNRFMVTKLRKIPSVKPIDASELALLELEEPMTNRYYRSATRDSRKALVPNGSAVLVLSSRSSRNRALACSFSWFGRFRLCEK
jgi:hypothetical protein